MANYGVSSLYNHIWDLNLEPQSLPFEKMSGKNGST